MSMQRRLNQWAVSTHATYLLNRQRSREALAARLQFRNERGDIEARAITIAFMAAAALAAGIVIEQKIDTKADSIQLD